MDSGVFWDMIWYAIPQGTNKRKCWVWVFHGYRKHPYKLLLTQMVVYSAQLLSCIHSVIVGPKCITITSFYPNLTPSIMTPFPPDHRGKIPSHERGQAILKGLQVPSNGGYSPSPPVSIMMTSMGLKVVPFFDRYNRSALHRSVMSW